MAHETGNEARALAALGEQAITLPASGYVETFPKSGVRLCARTGAATTAFSCPAYTALPIGLMFTLDNSSGSGDMTMTPTTGTPIVANAGEVWNCEVTHAGTVFAGQVTAAPTS